MTIYAHVSLEDKRKALGRPGRRWDDAVAVTIAVNRRIGAWRPEHRRRSEGVVRGGVEPPTFRFSGQHVRALCVPGSSQVTGER